MTEDQRRTAASNGDQNAPAEFALVVRRTIRAAPQALFDAWTQADLLVRWWGPAGVACLGAEIDLQPGGRYRIGNRLPDGQTLWITGVFERITPPRSRSTRHEQQSSGVGRVWIHEKQTPVIGISWMEC